MDSENKVLVLKEVAENYSKGGKISGIFRLEKNEKNTTISLSVINIATKTDGEFILFLITSNKQNIYFSLGLRPLSFKHTIDTDIDISKGIAVGVYYMKNNIPDIVCFCSDKGFQITIGELKKIVANYCLSEMKQQNEKSQQKNDVSSNESEDEKPILCDNSETKNEFSEYDDEVVATENYYEEDELKEKLLEVEKIENESSGNEDNVKYNFIKENKEENDDDRTFYEDEKEDYGEQKFDINNPYYKTVKTDLDNIFSTFPKEENLEKYLPQSSWVKVQYNGDKYYVVGKVISDGDLRYICYGVPSQYSKDPPLELAGFCSFIPLSVFDLQGDGYWMMFQDAITGECVHIGE